MNREKLTSRDISVEAFRLDNSRMLLVGRLSDDQAVLLPGPSAEPRMIGTIHEMRVELELLVPAMTIAAVRVEMPVVPNEDCRHIMPAVQELVGISMRRGFGNEMHRRLGGVRGCAHIRTLLSALGPVATRAATAFVGNYPLSKRLAANGKIMLNTCYNWRPDGPYGKWVIEASKDGAREGA